MKKWLTILLVLMLMVSVTACGGAEEAPGDSEPDANGQQEPEEGEGTAEEEPIKVGLILSGPINDGGWNSVAYEGLMKAEEKLGIETNYMESVEQSSNEEAFRTYATQGFDVIIGHGYQFDDAALSVSQDFQDIKFVVTSSDVNQEPNLAGLEVSNVESGFVAGMIAAAFTDSGKIAYIGGEEMPPIRDAEIGFLKAAEMVDDSIEVFSTLTGSFEDVVAAKSVTFEFIDNGADIVSGNANQAGLGVIEAAQEEGIYAVGFSGDQSDFAKETVIASSKYDYSVAIEFIVKEVLEDRFEAKPYLLATKEGATGVIWNEDLKPELDQEKVTLVEEMEEQLISREIDTRDM